MIMTIIAGMLGFLIVFIAQGIFGVGISYILSIIAIIMLLTFAIAFGKNWYILQKMREALAVLNFQCDPEKFIQMNKEILTKRIIKNKIEYFFIILNIAVGYFSNGNVDKAIDTAKDIPNNKIENNFFFKAAYYYNLATFYVAEEKWSEAEECINHLKDCYNTLATAPKNKNGRSIITHINKNKKTFEYVETEKLDELQGMIDEINICLGKREGHFQEIIDLYEKKFQYQNVPCSRCFSKYYQALCYEELGDLQAMKEALTFVAENGNKLHIASAAREILSNYKDIL